MVMVPLHNVISLLVLSRYHCKIFTPCTLPSYEGSGQGLITLNKAKLQNTRAREPPSGDTLGKNTGLVEKRPGDANKDQVLAAKNLPKQRLPKGFPVLSAACPRSGTDVTY